MIEIKFAVKILSVIFFHSEISFLSEHRAKKFISQTDSTSVTGSPFHRRQIRGGVGALTVQCYCSV